MKIFAILVGFVFLSMKVSASELKHTYKKTETLWFLSQLYYGHGHEYKKIMKTNGLTSPDEIAEGKVLIIEDYRFGDDAHFLEKRYQELMEKRETLLNKKANQDMEIQIKKTPPKTQKNSALDRLQLENPGRTANQELGN